MENMIQIKVLIHINSKAQIRNIVQNCPSFPIGEVSIYKVFFWTIDLKHSCHMYWEKRRSRTMSPTLSLGSTSCRKRSPALLYAGNVAGLVTELQTASGKRKINK